MKKLILAALIATVFCAPAWGQDALLDRLKQIEANNQFLLNKVAFLEQKIDALSAEVKALSTKQANVETKIDMLVFKMTGDTSTRTAPPAACGPQGCAPTAGYSYSPPAGAYLQQSGGGFFGNLKARRQARRGGCG